MSFFFRRERNKNSRFLSLFLPPPLSPSAFSILSLSLQSKSNNNHLKIISVVDLMGSRKGAMLDMKKMGDSDTRAPAAAGSPASRTRSRRAGSSACATPC